MKIVGIVVEYNPFHNGHLYQIEKIRQQTGCDYVVVVTSGDFTQRGEAAIVHKSARAQMALCCGVDLVIQLPSAFSTASAEYFAYSAVSHLSQMGIIDILCFGSECGDLYILQQLADILLEEPDAYSQALKSYLRDGLSFPRARSQALIEYTAAHCPQLIDVESVIASPNNILGIEYLKALKKLNSPITPVTIRREGSGYHDQSTQSPLASASAIRSQLYAGTSTDQLIHMMPASVIDILTKSQPFMCTQDFSAQLISRLLDHRDCLSEFWEVTDELANRMCGLLDGFTDYHQFARSLYGKNITETRVYRMLIHVLLGIKDNHLSLYAKYHDAPFIRVLGFKKSARPLLTALKAYCTVPVIYKLSKAWQELSPEQQTLLQLDLYASDTYRFAAQIKGRTALPNDYRQGLVLL